MNIRSEISWNVQNPLFLDRHFVRDCLYIDCVQRSSKSSYCSLLYYLHYITKRFTR